MTKTGVLRGCVMSSKSIVTASRFMGLLLATLAGPAIGIGLFVLLQAN